MTSTRSEKTIKNAIYGAGAYFIQIITTFAERIFFIQYLGVELLGINGLYTNILSVLSLADLGVNTALMYLLYKPLAENDIDEIKRIISSFKTIFKYIAFIILLIGLAFSPFLKYFIHKSVIDIQDLTVYFLLFTINSAISYLAVYKSTLIQADQKSYIVKIINSLIKVICCLFQIISLAFFGNYFIYLIILIISTGLNNILLMYITNKKYPYLRDLGKPILHKAYRHSLISIVKSTMIYKIATTVINSTANILISIFLGAIAVGYYTNYYTIIIIINATIGIMITALVPSLGNFLAKENNGINKEKLFIQLVMLFFFLSTSASCWLLTCYSGLITLWIGEQYIIDPLSVYAIILCFYLQCIAHPIWMFRESAGLFHEIKYWILSTAILNIVIASFLGNSYGIAGIVLATSLARIFTIFWIEPYILYSKVFDRSVFCYWKKWGHYFFLSIICGGFSLEFNVFFGDNIIDLFFKSVLVFFVCGIVFILGNLRTSELQYWISKGKQCFYILKNNILRN